VPCMVPLVSRDGKPQHDEPRPALTLDRAGTSVSRGLRSGLGRPAVNAQAKASRPVTRSPRRRAPGTIPGCADQAPWRS
jgi:hypothetical protein